MSLKKWPPLCEFRFYDGPPDDNPSWFDGVWTDRMTDLYDAAMLHWSERERAFYLGLWTYSKQWKVWDEKALRTIEVLMREDLTADGAKVEIRRFSGEGLACKEQMVWKVVVRDSS